MCAAEPALDRLAHVGQQMPPIGHLNRSGRPDRDAAGILARAVAGDDRDPWSLLQPNGQCRRSAVRQQVDDTMPLQVNDNRAVAAPFALPLVCYSIGKADGTLSSLAQSSTPTTRGTG